MRMRFPVLASLATVLLLLSLTGCGEEAPPEAKSSSETAAPSAAETRPEPAGDGAPQTRPQTASEDTAEPSKPDVDEPEEEPESEDEPAEPKQAAAEEDAETEKNREQEPEEKEDDDGAPKDETDGSEQTEASGESEPSTASAKPEASTESADASRSAREKTSQARRAATQEKETPAAFEKALNEIRRLRRDLQFAQALQRLRKAQRRFDAPALRKRLNGLAADLRQARQKAPQLRYALERMGESHGRHVSVAGRELLKAKDLGRLFLRHALRGKGHKIAGEATQLLARAGDPKAPALFVKRLEEAEHPWFRQVLLEGLRKLAEHLEPDQVQRLYKRLRAEEERFARRGLAGVLHAYHRRACGGQAELFNQRLEDEEAAAFLEKYIEDAQRSDESKVRKWAFKLTEGLHENFSAYNHHATAADMPGWREGDQCRTCRVNAKKFAQSRRRAVFFIDTGAGDDWQRCLLRDFEGELTGRLTFEFKFWETGSNHDGNLWIADENGEPLIGVGTENPQWEVAIRDEGEVVNDGGNGDDYEHWIHVVLEVDTNQNRARVTFDDLEDESRKRYGWFELPAFRGVSRLGVGPDNVWYVDDIRAYAGPPR
jgi:hypothetical protein